MAIHTVQCRSSLVPGAARCFIVKGGITLTGVAVKDQENPDNDSESNSNLDWAIPLVQSILQQYAHDDFKTIETVSSYATASSSSSSSWLLQQQSEQQQQLGPDQVDANARSEMLSQVHDLAAPFPHVMDVRFLNLQQEMDNIGPQQPLPSLDGNSTTGSNSTIGNRDNSGIFADGEKIYAITPWTWVVVSFAAVFVVIYGVFLCKRRVCAGCCRRRGNRNGRHASHYRLENGNGDDDDEESEAVLAHAVSHDNLSRSSTSGAVGVAGGFRSTSWSRRCPSWTLAASSLEEESLTGTSHHLELDPVGGIYHRVGPSHNHDVTGEPPIIVQQEAIQQMEQASLISGTFVEASITSLASGSFHEMQQQGNGAFPGMENTIIVVDESGIVGQNDDAMGNAYIDQRQSTIDVLDDIASSLSADDIEHFTLFPQPLSIPTSSSPSSNSVNNNNNNTNNLNDLFEADFDVPTQQSPPDLEASNNKDTNTHTLVTASSDDGDGNNMVLHYHDPNDPTRPPIDLNNIVDDLEQLANAPLPRDDDDDNVGIDDEFAVSIEDEGADSDLTSTASSDGGSGDKNDSSSSSNEDGSTGDWRATIV
jgi:hypothetical protein